MGESTLESFWDYAAKDLKLGFYLDSNHLYKHCLRFYFDNQDRDLSVEDMSELGRTWFHGIPSHQLDRAKFDTDIVRFNREIGVQFELGVTVTEITLDAEQGHLVEAGNKPFKCKYLVDAAGFASPLGKKLGLIESQDHRHPVSSAWGRFKFTQLIDHLGGEEWRARTNFTSRSLATNHFMYKGYWIWLIPLDEHSVSIGVTVKNSEVNINVKSAADFIEFLQSHRCMQEILGEQFEQQDYKAMCNGLMKLE